jgi:hypothetical protein
MQKASKLMPERGRINYNSGLMLQYLGRNDVLNFINNTAVQNNIFYCKVPWARHYGNLTAAKNNLKFRRNGIFCVLLFFTIVSL